jgi:hypothetical protein
MEWIRYHPRASAIGAGVATLLIIVFVYTLISPSDPKEPSTLGVPDPVTPTRTPLTELPTTTPKPSATPTAASTSTGQVTGFKGFGTKGATTAGGGVQGSGGTLSMPGLQGGSMYKYLPKHKIVLRVSAEEPIGTIGYVMPTSLRNPSGTVKNAGTVWTLTSTVYGDPDYAQLFFQAGQRGYPVTCTITVDGKVTEKRSTEGPYGQMVCQG